jgi:hypothetical protein
MSFIFFDDPLCLGGEIIWVKINVTLSENNSNDSYTFAFSLYMDLCFIFFNFFVGRNHSKSNLSRPLLLKWIWHSCNYCLYLLTIVHWNALTNVQFWKASVEFLVYFTFSEPWRKSVPDTCKGNQSILAFWRRPSGSEGSIVLMATEWWFC